MVVYLSSLLLVGYILSPTATCIHLTVFISRHTSFKMSDEEEEERI